MTTKSANALSMKACLSVNKVVNNGYGYDWQAPTGAYVDTRSIFPLLVVGQVAVALENAPRNVHVDVAYRMALEDGLIQPGM